MWNSPSSGGYIKNTSTCETTLTEHLPMLAEDLRLPKGQENLHVGAKEKKERERNWDGTCASEREL